MSKKAKMTFRVESELHAAFQQAVKSDHRPAAQVMRELMQAFVAQKILIAVPDAQNNCLPFDK